MKNESKKEENDFTVLVFGFLGLVALGVGMMFVVSLLNAQNYEKNLSAVVQSLENFEE